MRKLDCVIGMADAIGDDAARAFVVRFWYLVAVVLIGYQHSEAKIRDSRAMGRGIGPHPERLWANAVNHGNACGDGNELAWLLASSSVHPVGAVMARARVHTVRSCRRTPKWQNLPTELSRHYLAAALAHQRRTRELEQLVRTIALPGGPASPDPDFWRSIAPFAQPR